MSAWREFMAEADKAQTRNDLDHGITWTSDPDSSNEENVREFVTAFGWRGVGVREIVARTGVARTTVQRVLAGMTAVQIVETDTRGPRASKRQSYFVEAPPMVENLTDWENVVAVPGDESHLAAMIETGCGGGRKVHVGLPDY